MIKKNHGLLEQKPTAGTSTGDGSLIVIVE